MFVIYLLYAAFAGLALSCLALFRLRGDAPLPDAVTDEDGESEVERLCESALREWEQAALFLAAVFVFALIAPYRLLAAAFFVAYLIGAVQDLKSHSTSDLVLIPLYLFALKYGIDRGYYVMAVLTALIFTICIAKNGDSDIFGGADLIALLGTFAFLGFESGAIAMVAACVCGILTKLILWITKKDSREERGLPFLPALAIGSMIGLIIQAKFGQYYTIPLDDLLWLVTGK